MAYATGGASASQNVLDIKDRLKWHGHELQLMLFDWGNDDSWRREMNTHPEWTKVATAQARIIVLKMTGRFYSAMQMGRFHEEHHLGYRVGKERVYEIEKIQQAKVFNPEGRNFDKADLEIDLASAREMCIALELVNKKQFRLDFHKNKKKAAS